MNGTDFDRAARTFSASPGRRDVVRALVGVALGSATSLVTAARGHAAEQASPVLAPIAGDVSVEKKGKKKKKKEQRCKKIGQQCSRDVAGYCGFWWPEYYGSCTASLGSCCSLARQCKFGNANICIASNPYYVG